VALKKESQRLNYCTVYAKGAEKGGLPQIDKGGFVCGPEGVVGGFEDQTQLRTKRGGGKVKR